MKIQQKNVQRSAERCKGVHRVDLGESLPRSVYLQNLASIQPESFEVFRPGLSGAKVCASRRSRRELSNEYLLAKIRFDTAENGPLQVSQQLAKKLERKHELKSHRASVPGDARPGAGVQLRGAKSQIPKKRFKDISHPKQSDPCSRTSGQWRPMPTSCSSAATSTWSRTTSLSK